RAGRISILLNGPVDKSLAGIRRALEHAGNAVGDEFAANLSQLSESLTSAKRHATGIAADLARTESGIAAPQTTKAATDSRRQRAEKALDNLERELKGELAKNVRIDRYRFDRSA